MRPLPAAALHGTAQRRHNSLATLSVAREMKASLRREPKCVRAWRRLPENH
jgi:hypothetical protein